MFRLVLAQYNRSSFSLLRSDGISLAMFLILSIGLDLNPPIDNLMAVFNLDCIMFKCLVLAFLYTIEP